MARANGQGTIMRHPTRAGWHIAKVVIGGKQRQSQQPNRKAAQAWIDDQHGRAIGGELPAALTVRGVCERWLSRHVDRSTRSPSTKRTRHGDIARVLDHLPDSMPAHAMTAGHAHDAFTAMADAGYAQKTMTNALSALRMAFSSAVDEGMLSASPIERYTAQKLPTGAAKRERRALTPDERDAVLSAMGEHPWSAAAWLCFHLGLRPGEALGLRWSAVDMSRGELAVCSSLRYQKGGTYISPTTKTHETRTLPLTDELAGILRAHKSREAHRQLAAERWVEPDPSRVFSTNTGRVVALDAFSEMVGDAAEAAGIERITPHEMRHTFATIAANDGMSLYALMSAMGHKMSTTTDVYFHRQRVAPIAEHVTRQMRRDTA